MKKLTLVSGVLALALLASCGGGGSGGGSVDTTAPASGYDQTAGVTAGDASRYAGTWVACNSTGATTSEREVVVLTATGANTVSFSDTSSVYSGVNCTGSVGSSSSKTGTLAFAGTKTVGTDTVDKGLMTRDGVQKKNIFLVTATTLKTGRAAEDGGTLDADGYPNTLDTNGLTRQ
jgi:hypothetical protein